MASIKKISSTDTLGYFRFNNLSRKIIKRLKLILIILLVSNCFSKAQVNWLTYLPSQYGYNAYEGFGLAIDTSGNPWQVASCFAMDDFIYKLEVNQWSIPDTNINGIQYTGGIAIDHYNNLWFSNSYGGISKWNNGLIQQYSPPPLLGYPILYFPTFDHNNCLWSIAETYGKAPSIIKFDGINWTIYDSSQTGIPSGHFISQLVIDKFNNVLTTADTCGIFKFDGVSWQNINSSNSNLPSNVFLRGVTSDSIGNYYTNGNWLNGDTYFGKFVTGNFTNYTLPWEFDPTCADIMVDSSNNIWYYTQNSDLVKFNGSYFSTYQSPFVMGSVFNTKIDKKGNIWISGYGSQIFTMFKFNKNGFQSVEGFVYDDFNQNGIKDNNEGGLANEFVSSSLSPVALTDSTGHFSIAYVDSAQTFVLSHIIKPYRIQSSSPSTFTITPSINVSPNYNFGIYTIPNVTDLEIYAAIPTVKAGHNSNMWLTYKNVGTNSQSDSIVVNYDSKLQYNYSSVIPSFQAQGILKFNYSNLSPNSSGSIHISFLVDSNAVLGDSIQVTATIYPVAIDTIPNSNLWVVKKVVKSSWDPNIKEVNTQGGAIDPNQKLVYTINFQNTGNDSANTITIYDTLSSNLDITSFQLLNSSHHLIVELIDNSVMKFIFSKIMLVDSGTNEPESHGFVSYSILPKPGLTTGAQILNTASIIFDWNVPVVTNTTLNFVSILSINSPLASDFSIYPNPSNNFIIVNSFSSLKGNQIVSIIDINGKVIKESYFLGSFQNIKIDVNDLAKGVYIVKIDNHFSRFVKF